MQSEDAPSAQAMHFQRRTYAMNEHLSHDAVHFWVTVQGFPPPPGIIERTEGLKIEYIKKWKGAGGNNVDKWDWTVIPLYMDGYWRDDHILAPGVGMLQRSARWRSSAST